MAEKGACAVGFLGSGAQDEGMKTLDDCADKKEIDRFYAVWDEYVKNRDEKEYKNLSQVYFRGIKDRVVEILDECMKSGEIDEFYLAWNKIIKSREKLVDYVPYLDRDIETTVIYCDAHRRRLANSETSPINRVLDHVYRTTSIGAGGGMFAIHFPYCLLDEELIDDIIRYYSPVFNNISVQCINKNGKNWIFNLILRMEGENLDAASPDDLLYLIESNK